MVTARGSPDLTEPRDISRGRRGGGECGQKLNVLKSNEFRTSSDVC